MVFKRELRPRVVDGTITQTVRIWTNPHVKAGGRYRFEDGWICVTSVREITLGDIDTTMAKRSGFGSVIELLRVAKHGAGSNIYLIDFYYEPDSATSVTKKGADAGAPGRTTRKPARTTSARNRKSPA
ncbi:MAG: ASCH domain-containing protein [Pseudomonadota bacterium]